MGTFVDPAIDPKIDFSWDFDEAASVAPGLGYRIPA